VWSSSTFRRSSLISRSVNLERTAPRVYSTSNANIATIRAAPFTVDMSIGFRMKTVEHIRAELEKMTDAQLIEHGKTLRRFCRPTRGHRVHRVWLMQLKEARVEWRRWHPPKKFGDN
jgi:hypothetical protein